MNHEPLVAELESACAAFEEMRVDVAVDALIVAIRKEQRTFSSSLAQRALKALRRKRYFRAALRLGDVIFESGQREPLVQLVYAQALIDSGRVAASIPFLETIIASATPRSHAGNEARGLLGRAYKQLYVNGAGEIELRTDYLVRAFNAYYDVYRDNPAMTWHGINAAAVMRRAADDKLRDFPKIEPFVRELYDALQDAKKDVWGLATLAEASLAINSTTEARKWYDEFAKHEKADAFEIGSALRQLEEVWQLREDASPGREILPLLRARLLQAPGGEVKLSSLQARRDRSGPDERDLQAIFGKESARAVTWYRLGLQRCLTVCRVETAAGAAHGTGFLVDGAWFGRAGERLVLTNHHVVSDTHWMSIRDTQARVAFTALEDDAAAAQKYAVKMLWTSPILDATLLRLTPAPPDLPAFGRAMDCPRPIAERTTRVYVIGHPMGAPLAISLYDNDLIDSDDRRLHYLAPTLKGNSGSPVFDEHWELVGLHHAGSETMQQLPPKSGTYKANEALWIGAIAEAAKP
jgi:S1-C subfamily serine protease